MTLESDADKKDLYEGIWDKYYNSESEGKEFKDYFYAPEEYGTWQTQSKNNNQSEETFINTWKKPSVRKTATKKPTFKRKELPISELHPFSAFPFRLEYQDGKDKRVCHFECEQHRDKHIARYKLRKGSYAIDNLT